MTIKEMQDRKRELGYTNEMIAEKSGIPLSTVQKIFSGATKNPRYSTKQALEMVLKMPLYYEPDINTAHVAEEAQDYSSMPGTVKQEAKKIALERVFGSEFAKGATFENFSLKYYPEPEDASGVSPQKRMGEIATFCKDYASDFSTDSNCSDFPNSSF